MQPSFDFRVCTGLRHALQLATGIALLATCAELFGQEVERTLDLPLPPHILKQCNEGGGCMLVTRKQIQEEIEQEIVKALDDARPAVKEEGYVAGYLKGAMDAVQQIVRTK